MSNQYVVSFCLQNKEVYIEFLSADSEVEAMRNILQSIGMYKDWWSTHCVSTLKYFAHRGFGVSISVKLVPSNNVNG